MTITILAALLLASCATAPAMTSDPVGEKVELPGVTGALHGTLLVPANQQKAIPVALLIAGSGPTDRDGNSPLLSGPNNSLRMLAEALARNGIASLRYDKRGIGASAPIFNEADLRFDHYADDAAQWVRMLRRDPRFSTITVIGHSEGSLLGILAAQKAGADAFVSIAGAGRTTPDLLREQLRPQLSKELWDESERVLENLIAGKTVSPVNPALFMLYRPSVQPYLISWFAYDPAKEIARLQVPVLIVQGTTDVQATRADAEALVAAAPRGELAMISGMNHVLKIFDGDRDQHLASYGDPSLPLAPELEKRIVAFIPRK